MMILSKYPILEYSFVQFSQQSWLDAWACPKGYLKVRIHLFGRHDTTLDKEGTPTENNPATYDLVLYNVHTTPGTYANTAEDKTHII